MPGELGEIEPCIHARQHGKATCGWQGEFGFLTEVLAVPLICIENLIEDIAHFTPPRTIWVCGVTALKSKHVRCAENEAERKGGDGDLANCPYCKRPQNQATDSRPGPFIIGRQVSCS
jgi:hypothetical protein